MKNRLLVLALVGLALVGARDLVGGRVLIPSTPLAPLVEWFLPHAAASYVPSAIKSVTAISLGGSTTQTVSVTAANSLLIFDGMSPGTNNAQGGSRATITNGTTITSVNGGGGGTWKGSLIEFYGGFVTAQSCGTITILAAATSGTATISSVSTTRTIVAWEGFSSAANVDGNAGVMLQNVVLTNATTLTATTLGTSGVDRIVGYCYVQMR